MPHDSSDSTPHVIIAGFGLPGRAVASVLDAQHIPYCVIELNAATVKRCAKSGTHIVEGDVTDPNVLTKARIAEASAIFIAIPNEEAALEATRRARQLSATVKIIARTHFTSAGLEAKVRGADAVVVAEQVVAAELSRMAGEMFLVAMKPSTT